MTASMGGVAAAETSAAAAEETSASQVGEIIVTATRRAERTVDVPVAVSVLEGQKLAVLNSSGADIRFLSGRVPSLLAESSFGRTFPRFYIRGLGNTDFSADAAQPVSVVYDNVALESPFLKAFPAFDLENVEVLKGPQGTLFGRNTPAGVIRLTSAKPTDYYSGHGSISWGTYNTVNSEVAVSGPITDKLRFRVSGLLQRRDDWVKNDYTATMFEDEFEGYRDLAGRAQLEYEDGPMDILLNVHARQLRGSARMFRANVIEPGTNHFTDAFDVEHVAQNGSNPQRLDSVGANLQISYKFDGAGSFYWVTGYERVKVYSRGDIDGGFGASFAPPFGPGFIPFPVETGGSNKPEEFTQELRFASEKFNDFSYQVGAYFFDQNLDGTGGSWNLAGAFAPGSSSHLDNRTYALFGSVEYTPTDNLILRGGLRWSHDKKKSFLYNGPDAASSTALVIGEAEGSKWSWDASATYKLTPDYSVYGRIAHGYLGAAIKNDITAGVSTIAKPQTTTSYEVGFKGQQRGLFSYAADIYYFDTKDIQLTAVGGGSNVTRLLNAKKAEGYGVEGEFTFTPIERLVLSAGGSYNHTKLKDPDLRVAPCGGGCTVTDPVDASGLASINGNPLPQAPKWIFNFTAGYAIPVGEQKELFAYTDWAYRSKVNFFLYESIEFTGRSSLEGGLRLGYRDLAKKWEVAAFARNITNQIRAVSAIDFNNLTAMVNEPRIIGGEFKISY
ncbi:TonB-dependent receptor [Phenylobacterium sp. LjRoot225]|uniref:TonB-dependent receptor n=1 Tax=Phenylobacterium sp. LjRoot225 TaxID=3342285 RepID=UPI003ED03979